MAVIMGPDWQEQRAKAKKLNDTKAKLSTMTGGDVTDEQAQAFMDTHTMDSNGNWISNDYKTRLDNKLAENRRKAQGVENYQDLGVENTFQDVYKYYAPKISDAMKGQALNSVPNAVNNPYQSEISNVQKAYEEMLRKQNRANDLAVEQGVNEYQSQKDSVNQNYDGMARDAYVTMMMGKKNMPQQLAASGIRGGGTETANLGLQTAYQNNLNSVEQNRTNDIKSIDDAILQLQNQGDLNATQNALDIQQQQLNAYMQLMDKSTNYNTNQQEQYKQDYANTATGYANDYQAQINNLLAQGYSPDSYEVKVLNTLREQKIQGQAQAQAQAQADALKQANLDRNYNLDYMKTMYDVNKPYSSTGTSSDNNVSYSTVKGIIDNNYISKDPLTNSTVADKNAIADYIERESNAGRLSDNDRTSLYNYYGIEDTRPYKQAVAQKLLQNGATEQAVLQFLNDNTVTADVLKQMLAQ